MPAGNDNSNEYRRRICLAVDFIHANLAENPSMDEIAHAAAFSKFHFQRLFKALVGETVAEFTRRLRLETAARRLVFNPGTDITGLAFDLGFSSSQNFAKAFRKQFGVSPTQFRDERTLSAGEAVKGASPEESTNGNIDRTQINAGGDGDSYDPATVLKDSVLSGIRDEDQTIDVEVRDMPALRVVYRRHFGSYADPGVQTAFDELQRWAEPRGLYDPRRCLGIPWDDADITPGDRCRFDACQIVEEDSTIEGSVNEQSIPAGRYAVYQCEVTGHDFARPWTTLMLYWLPFSGYQPADGPRYERYVTDGRRDPEGRWQVEICLPVKPL